MVYKTKFLKQIVDEDVDISSAIKLQYELSNEAMAGIWLTLKGTRTQDNVDIIDALSQLTMIDVWMGGFNIMHYTDAQLAVAMNCKLKGAHPYVLQPYFASDADFEVCFPLLFGAPYINESMALPRSESNRKKITLTFDPTQSNLTLNLLDIAEVILPSASPVGCIKQEEVDVEGKGTGDKDIWLQTNWDLLKLLLKCTRRGDGDANTWDVSRVGLEIDDFAFGYKNVPYSILHGELMDELEGGAQISSCKDSGGTGFIEGICKWLDEMAQLDFFYNYDLKWKAPLKNASTAKLKLHYISDHEIEFAQANYVPNVEL